jgi:hypothetical protein
MTLPILVGLALHASDSVPPLPRLRVEGPNFVDERGAKVLLRGVNLGGWFVEEIWMTPFVENPPEGTDLPKVRDHKTLWEVVERRLGREGMLRVRNAWRDNWITADDFRLIAQRGFNHVRLPILWSLIEEPGGLDRIRTAVRWAAENRLYVVLDLHGAPGSQSQDHHTGEENRNRLWFEPANIQKLVEVWRTLTREFAQNPTVAVFDLMNEPMGAPNPAMLHLVHDRVIRAVREISPLSIVMIEDGYKGLETTPHLDLAGWSNAAFSIHTYHFEAKKESDHLEKLRENAPRWAELMGYRNAPLYIGEFNLEPHSSPAATRDVVLEFEKHGWSWALWTYKTMAKAGPMGQWGLFSLPGPAQAIDPYRDSEAEMIRKIRLTRTERMREVPGLAEALTRR